MYHRIVTQLPAIADALQAACFDEATCQVIRLLVPANERPDSCERSGLSMATAALAATSGLRCPAQAVAASFSFFIGRTLTLTVAGLAANVVS
jgi:hypothetical protein